MTATGDMPIPCPRLPTNGYVVRRAGIIALLHNSLPQKVIVPHSGKLRVCTLSFYSTELARLKTY